MAVDEYVRACPGGTAGPGGVVGGAGGAGTGVPGPLAARPLRGSTAMPTMGRVRLVTPPPKSAASPKARSSPALDACQ